MAPQGGRWQRRIQAAESAGRLLDELSVDQTEQIDVFGICEDLGLWLTFLPMDNLLGAFVPEGVGGVLVTTQRPIPIQRYTDDEISEAIPPAYTEFIGRQLAAFLRARGDA